MKISQMSSDERPMERMLCHGVESLSNAELISILLHTGCREKGALDLARDLLDDCGGSLNVLAAMSIERISAIKGLGTRKATTILSALELGRRFLDEGIAYEMPTINSSEEIFQAMLPKMKGLDHEELWVVFMGTHNRVLGYEKMSSGGTESTVIDKMMILKRAIVKNAAGIVLVHNHPSGLPTPSSADITETEALKAICEMFDIKIIDHVIMTYNAYFSFTDEVMHKRRKTRKK